MLILDTRNCTQENGRKVHAPWSNIPFKIGTVPEREDATHEGLITLKLAKICWQFNWMLCSLAGQTLSRAERVWSNCHHRLVSNTLRISWRVNWLSGEWDGRGCLFWHATQRERSVLTEASLFRTRPNHVHTYFIKYPAAEYATPNPDGNLTRLSPPQVRVWPLSWD